MNQTSQPILVIFSGLPGTGKSTLTDRLARELRWPLLRIDDVAGQVPPEADYHFWDEKILLLLNIAEVQLELGVSVIADSVFMGTDRLHAQEIAQKHDAIFRPVYCFVSNEATWEKRVNERFDTLQRTDVATWEQIQHQRQWFTPWQSGTGLFIDAVEPVEQNYAKVLEFVSSRRVSLEPLQIRVPLVKGQYHV
ncbi:MAG: ATP-binding protein [Anaerolineales bacterium]|nr:ATP-binding protein [Anaerolineales bacterium]